MAGAPRIAIAICSCVAHAAGRQQAIRDTWMKDVPKHVLAFFFVGRPGAPAQIEGDTLYLDCADGYADLALKTHACISYCVSNIEFDYLLKCDDDTYLYVRRFLENCMDCFKNGAADYIGNLPPGISWQAGAYAQGGAYILSRKAAAVLSRVCLENERHARWWYGNLTTDAKLLLTHTTVEDIMVGDILRKHDIYLEVDTRFCHECNPFPYDSRRQFTCHHASPELMRHIHRCRRLPLRAARWMKNSVVRMYRKSKLHIGAA
jgi:hypothetical protein